jgi:adenosylcobyric acid synthase
MHIGVTAGPDGARPFACFANGVADGAMAASGRVLGTYIHGLFADDRQRSAWLKRLAAGESEITYEALVEQTLDRLAAHLEAHVDIDRLLTLSR